MNEALYKWEQEVANSKSEADGLDYEISAVTSALRDLSSTIDRLKACRFQDAEDYTIRMSAQQLWDLVSQGCRQIRHHLDDARTATNDLRRAADFYSGH